jgi:hypothetical protein
MRTLKIVIAAIIAIVATGLLAAPAFAASNPPVTINVSATVSSAATISGLTDVNFGTVAAGTTATQTGAESFTVSSNDANGYQLNTLAGSASFSGPGTINDSNWTVTETGFNSGFSYNPSAGQATIGTTSAASVDHYTENWSLAIPPTAPAGTYTNTLSYILTPK